ncbi:unannotated protein [freshwater metagenome]|uniref:Unannotated protein n=1 Tax=freshwater metagenome TaxID=449393 RepID=A0A6J6CZB7_9ZZZZ|nr:hypothetical protein [Actinomycetota bacterium]
MRFNRTIVIAMSALEAALAVAIGLAIPLIPLTLMWVTRLDSGLGWDVYWRASSDIWLLGHGVDILVKLDPALSTALGVPGTDAPFFVSLAPLAFALITVLLGVRLGRRAVEAGTAYIGPAAGIMTFFGLAILIVLSADHPAVSPSLAQSVVLPGLVFAIGVVIGARGEIGRSGGRAEQIQLALTKWLTGLPQGFRAVVSMSIAGGGIATAALVAVAGITLSVALVGNFATIVSLYEGLQGGVAGSMAITAIELLYMPVFVVWVAAWFVGPGFAIGTGSSVTPMGSSLGPVPSIPIFGALPPAQLAFGFICLVVPVAVGFLAGYAVRGRTLVAYKFAEGRQARLMRAVTPLGIAVCGGVLLGGLAWLASGSIGPGRLVDVGPNLWIVAGVFAAELLVASALGMAAPRPSRRSR